MDYLPIQPSAVPCERVFSSSAETDTKKRNRISPALMEALQMVKFSLKKERLDFAKYHAMSEREMLFNEDTEDTLASLAKAGNSNDAMVRVIDAIASAEGDAVPDRPQIFR
jgi:hypothetical protein